MKEFKEQEKVMCYLGKLYQRCKRDMQVEDQQSDQYYNDAKFVMKIDLVVKDLPKEYQLVIQKDYLQVSEGPWYLNYFSRSSYYRIRNKAVKEFISYID